MTWLTAESIDARAIADYDPEKFAALCAERPAVHRFPGSMAKRIQALAQEIVDQYNGDAAALRRLALSGSSS